MHQAEEYSEIDKKKYNSLASFPCYEQLKQARFLRIRRQEKLGFVLIHPLSSNFAFVSSSCSLSPLAPCFKSLKNIR